MILSCSTAPEFNRNNIQDPGSKDYFPSLSHGPIFDFYIDSTRSLNFDWSFIAYTGAIISKKNIYDSEFMILDTLPNQIREFKDPSSLFEAGTIYQLKFFHDLDDRIIYNPNEFIFPIDVAPFSDIDIFKENSNLVIITNFVREETNPSDLIYFDGVKLFLKNQNLDNNWNLVEELSLEDFGFQFLPNGKKLIVNLPIQNLNSADSVRLVQFLNRIDGSETITQIIEQDI